MVEPLRHRLRIRPHGACGQPGALVGHISDGRKAVRPISSQCPACKPRSIPGTHNRQSTTNPTRPADCTILSTIDMPRSNHVGGYLFAAANVDLLVEHDEHRRDRRPGEEMDDPQRRAAKRRRLGRKRPFVRLRPLVIRLAILDFIANHAAALAVSRETEPFQIADVGCAKLADNALRAALPAALNMERYRATSPPAPAHHSGVAEMVCRRSRVIRRTTFSGSQSFLSRNVVSALPRAWHTLRIKSAI